MSEGTRRTASTVTAVLGAALVVAGGIALYARQEIFRPDPFAERAVRALNHEQVRAALARPIVEKALDKGPDELINATPVLEAAVDGAIQSAAFRKLFRGAVRTTYTVLVDGDADELAVTVDDANVVVAQAIGAISPRLVGAVPDDIGDRLVEVSDSRLALRLARVAERVRFLGLVLPILGVLLLAGSIALAPDRRRALLWCAGSLAVFAALGLIAWLVARSLVLSQFGDDTVRGAVGDVWQVYFADLRAGLIAVGGLALLTAAAAAMGREVDPLVPARAVAVRVVAVPSTTAWRVARAVLVAAAGLLLFLEPALALQLVAMVLGAYALFFAACELMSVAAPPPPRRRRTADPSRPLRLALATVGAVVLIGLLAVLLSGGDDEIRAERAAGPVEVCNGYAELCDRTLNEVVLPASHNSMAAAELPGWYQPNQRFGIKRQLADGIRVFQIDTHPGVKRRSGPVVTDLSREDEGLIRKDLKREFGAPFANSFGAISRAEALGGNGVQGEYLCHVVCELGSIELTKALRWYRDFLDAHPDEVVVLFLEDHINPEATAKRFKESGILRYAYVHDRDEPFPTLRKLIESDKRLFVLAENDNGNGEYPWYHDGFDLTQETPFTFHSPAELAAPDSCRPERGDADGPLFQLNHWVERIPRSPATAREVNSFDFLTRRARVCERRRGLAPSWTAVDFYNEGNLFDVVRALNGLPREQEPSYRTTR